MSLMHTPQSLPGLRLKSGVSRGYRIWFVVAAADHPSHAKRGRDDPELGQVSRNTLTGTRQEKVELGFASHRPLIYNAATFFVE
jgi:hypothetical protein